MSLILTSPVGVHLKVPCRLEWRVTRPTYERHIDMNHSRKTVFFNISGIHFYLRQAIVINLFLETQTSKFSHLLILKIVRSTFNAQAASQIVGVG